MPLAAEYTFDLTRILWGDKPPWFLLEVALRTVVIFGYTLSLLRLMGKRGMGNLTPFEFAIIVALGSAVGDPMFYDDVPLTHTMLVIALVVGMQRGLAWLTNRSTVAEKVIESSPRLLVREGVIQVDALRDEQLSHDELCEGLRLEGVRQLGEVDLALLEPSGQFSVMRQRPPRPGLSLTRLDSVEESTSSEAALCAGLCCCAYCGLVAGEPRGECPNCNRREWTKPVEPGGSPA